MEITAASTLSIPEVIFRNRPLGASSPREECTSLSSPWKVHETSRGGQGTIAPFANAIFANLVIRSPVRAPLTDVSFLFDNCITFPITIGLGDKELSTGLSALEAIRSFETPLALEGSRTQVALDVYRFLQHAELFASGDKSSHSPGSPRFGLNRSTCLSDWLRSVAEGDSSRPIVQREEPTDNAVLAKPSDEIAPAVERPQGQATYRVPKNAIRIAQWTGADEDEWSQLEYEVGLAVDTYFRASDADSTTAK